MNNNPEGTPNPLNPNPTPVGPAAAPGVTPVAPQPTAQPAPQPAAPVQPAPAAPAPEQPVAGNDIEAALAEEQTVPTQPVEEPAKKKNGGLIAIIAALIVVLVGCVVAAIVAFDPFRFFGGASANDDRVPKALAALFTEGAPTNVGMDGSVTLYTYDENSPVVSLEVDFSSKTAVKDKAGMAEATITANFTDDTYFKFDADEIHTEDGDLYLKLSGITEAITNYNNQKPVVDCDASDVVDCAASATEIDQYIAMLQSSGIIDVIDDEWILIPSTSFSNVDDLTQLEAPTQCLIDATGTIGEYTDDLMTAYNTNPFITYSTENLAITKKQDNLYKLGIDADALTGFINAMNNSGFVNELNACMGNTATNSDVDTEDIAEIVNALPTIYVEVNKDYQFTRVYLKASGEDGNMEAIADISLSYPTEITITEPTQYVDINTVISNVLNMIYGGVIPQDESTLVEE